MAKFVFLGRLEDLAGAAEMPMPMDRPTALGVLLDSLPHDLAAALRSPKLRIALNGELVGADRAIDEVMIAQADEIAFLPPVSGG
jgi:molybdopterin synthase sulfur carrier subunit